MSSPPADTRSRALAGDTDAASPADARVEYCPACGRETDHEVRLTMVSTATDGINDSHRKFAQAPGRVVTCTACGREHRSLVNR